MPIRETGVLPRALKRYFMLLMQALKTWSIEERLSSACTNTLSCVNVTLWNRDLCVA